MKNLCLLLVVVFFSSALNAQTWKKNIYGTLGNKGVRTVRIKPSSSITVRSLVLCNDSVSYSTTFTGTFDGATDESLRIKLDNFSDLKVLASGIKYSTTIPGKIYSGNLSSDSGKVTVPLSDIGYLMYKNNRLGKVGEAGEGAIFASLFVLFISPFICIDYKEGTFNAERYKYWALGSSAALFGCITVEALFNGQKRFQFTAGWPMKKQKVWSFNRENN